MYISKVNGFNTPPQSAARNTIFNLIGCLAYQGCQWLVTILVVYIAGFEASGYLAFAMAIGNVFLPLATFNLRTYQVSDVSDNYSHGCYFAFRVRMILFALVATCVYSLITVKDISFVPSILAYLLFKIDESVCDVLSGVDQRFQRMDYIGVSQFLRGVLLLAGFSIGAYVSGNVAYGIIGMWLPCFFMTVFYDIPHVRRLTDLDINIHRSEFIDIFKSCLPLAISALMFSLTTTIARQLFGNTYGAEQLGIYASIATPAILIQAASRYLYAPLLTPLALAYRDGYSKLRTAFCQYTSRLVSATVFIGLVLFFLAPQLLNLLFGPSVSKLAIVFDFMLIATFLNAFINYLSDFLVVCEDYRTPLLASIISLVACCLFVYPFESFIGMNGINVTLLVSYGCAVLFLLYKVIRRFAILKCV